MIKQQNTPLQKAYILKKHLVSW